MREEQHINELRERAVRLLRWYVVGILVVLLGVSISAVVYLLWP